MSSEPRMVIPSEDVIHPKRSEGSVILAESGLTRTDTAAA